ncbi:DUF4959 domain-containing protein [Parabacteroides segnis]|uniref:DUF4959 domain-containing protein n=1 Tax=Parabacteroides segnis TaxID=2763058 RepID=UPI0035136D35
MKKNIFYLIAGISGWLSFASCSDNDNGYPTPTAIEQSSITSKSGPGNVTLYWDVPADSNYYYVQVKYMLPNAADEYIRLASVYSDSIAIDGLLKRYGNINFTLQPFSKDGKGGETCSIAAEAGSAPKEVVITGKTEAIALTAEQLFTDNQETSEGPIANLVDGDKSTYFHMSWSAPTAFPHYIVIDLKKDIYACTFSYTGRDNANKDNPGTMDILVSNTFDGSNYDLSQTTLLSSLSDLPGDKAASYISGVIKSDQAFRYLWLKVKSSTSGSNWIALAELSITEQLTTVRDPEAEE